jgi:hypothetical protein
VRERERLGGLVRRLCHTRDLVSVIVGVAGRPGRPGLGQQVPDGVIGVVERPAGLLDLGDLVPPVVRPLRRPSGPRPTPRRRRNRREVAVGGRGQAAVATMSA